MRHGREAKAVLVNTSLRQCAQLLVMTGLLSCALSRPAAAQVDARALRAALGRVGAPLARNGRVGALVEHPLGAPRGIPGLTPLTSRFSVLRTRAQDFDAISERLLGSQLLWSPPRQFLLDRAAHWTGLDLAHDTGATGQGVVVGIVDTGVDLTHPDLRNADGSTRIAWLLDLSRPPAGLQPDLEDSYACSSDSGFECQILSADDINTLLQAGDLAALPGDELGHGTHVASLAAGNGLSHDPPRYVGAAPEATLVVVRATRQSGGVDDFDILLSTDFVFERAKAMGLPAVVNLSLGSDFGPHDGTSAIGRALVEFVQQPGRAIVVAAGNSGALYTGASTGYPSPFGVHTDVFVPSGEGVRVPLLTPRSPTGAERVKATLFVWIGFDSDSDLEVGLDRLNGPWIEPVGRGQGEQVEDDGLEVTVLNNQSGEGSPLPDSSNGAVVLLDGEWEAGRTFVLRLRGEGAASLWVQSEGELSPALGTVGALFPRASAAQTVNIPAVQPELIAVGASINRDNWPTRAGMTARVTGEQLELLSAPDTVAWFSSAGPTQTGTLKPDLLAPGGFVVGAMSLDADPDTSPFSLFADTSGCNGVPGCSVVDDYHAVTTGTSMSAPIAAGAVALLFQRDPTLTQLQVRDLLQAGARKLQDAIVSEEAVRSGAGLLDIQGALDALEQRDNPEARSASRSRSNLVFAGDFLRPQASSKLQGLIQLRDGQGRAVGDVSARRLELLVEHAHLARRPTQQAPGLYSFELQGIAGNGGSQARVQLLFDGEPWLTGSIPVAVDPAVAREGVQSSGGCSLPSRRASRSLLGALSLLLVGLILRRRAAVSR